MLVFCYDLLYTFLHHIRDLCSLHSLVFLIWNWRKNVELYVPLAGGIGVGNALLLDAEQLALRGAGRNFQRDAAVVQRQAPVLIKDMAVSPQTQRFNADAPDKGLPAGQADSLGVNNGLPVLHQGQVAGGAAHVDDDALLLVGQTVVFFGNCLHESYAALVHQKQQEIHDGIGKLALIAFHQELFLRLPLDLRILEEAADLRALEKILPHTCQLITIGLKLVLLLGNLEDRLGIFTCKL